MSDSTSSEVQSKLSLYPDRYPDFMRAFQQLTLAVQPQITLANTHPELFIVPDGSQLCLNPMDGDEDIAQQFKMFYQYPGPISMNIYYDNGRVVYPRITSPSVTSFQHGDYLIHLYNMGKNDLDLEMTVQQGTIVDIHEQQFNDDLYLKAVMGLSGFFGEPMTLEQATRSLTSQKFFAEYNRKHLQEHPEELLDQIREHAIVEINRILSLEEGNEYLRILDEIYRLNQMHDPQGKDAVVQIENVMGNIEPWYAISDPDFIFDENPQGLILAKAGRYHLETRLIPIHHKNKTIGFAVYLKMLSPSGTQTMFNSMYIHSDIYQFQHRHNY